MIQERNMTEKTVTITLDPKLAKLNVREQYKAIHDSIHRIATAYQKEDILTAEAAQRLFEFIEVVDDDLWEQSHCW